MRISTVALALVLGASGAYAQTDIKEDAARCQGCHDTGGPSTIPRLNGQRADYILARLRAFHNPATQTPHATYFMWDIASSLGAAKAKALAEYFAAQPPTPAKPGNGATAGAAFYQGAGGCQACHGHSGEGGKDAAPRLAGQHNLYLQQQLASFGLLVRYQPQMVQHSVKLTPEQINALVAWLGSD